MTTPIGITIGLDGVQQTEAGLRRVVGGVDAVGISAKQTAAALRGVPAQFTDIITSLQGGQAPLTVFLQQGGQLKDMFGGAGNAARALGGYVVGLVNPFTVAAAAGVALAVAYNQGSKEADAYTKSIALTGNAAGVTTAQLQGMAGRVSDVVGTQAKASEVLAQLVGTGNVAKAALEQQAATSIRLERNVGIAVKDTVKEFSELGKEPVEAAKKLNERYNYLTTAVYEQIKALKDQGKTQEAVALSQDAYEKAMSNVATTLEGQLGTLERGWRNIADAAKAGWDAMLNVGRKSTMSDEIGRVRTLIENKQVGLDSYRDTRAGQIVVGEIDALKQKLGVMESDERMLRRGADAQALRTQAEKDGIAAAEALQKVQGKGLTQQQQMNKALEEYRRQVADLRAVNPNSERLTPSAIAQGERAIREQYKPKGGSGAASGGENEVAALRAQADAAEKYLAQLRATGAEVEKLTSGEQRAGKIREELKTSITGTARAQKELALVEAERLGTAERATVTQKALIKSIEESEAAYRKVLDAITKTGDAYGAQADQQEAANASLGRSKTAIEQAALAQQQLYLANEKAAGPWDPERIKAMEYAIDQQKRYVDALQGGDGKALNARADELLRSAQELSAIYADESQLVGLSNLERTKTVALRQVELKYAKELADVEKSSASEEAKQNARDTINRAKRTEGEAVVAKAIQDDWTKTTDEINRSLTDALLRGFESGKGFAENLRDTVKNMFSTLVLRPVISAVVNPVAGAITGALGLAGSASAGASAAGAIGNGASLLGSAGGLLSGAGSAAGYGFSALMSGNGLGALGGGLGMLTSGGPAAIMAQGAGMIAGVLGPIALGIGALTAIIGKTKGETRFGGGFEVRDGSALRTTGDVSNVLPEGALISSVQGTFDTINGLFEKYGSQFLVTNIQAGIETSGKGRGGTFAGGLLSGGGASDIKFGEFFTDRVGASLNAEEALKAFSGDLNKAVISALQKATDLPKFVQRQIEGVDVKALGGDKAAELLQAIGDLPNVLLQGFGTTRDALAQQFAQGLALGDATAAGQSVADTLVASIEASLFTDASGKIFDIVNNGIVAPMLDAIATGASVSEALSQASIDKTIERAKTQASALAELFGNAEFTQALEQIRTTVGSALGQAGESFGYTPKFQLQAAQQIDVAAQSANRAAEDAQRAAEDAAKAWQDITNALLGSRADADIALLRAQGKEEQALAAERARATVGYDAYQVSLYDGTQAIFRQIEAIDKATEARGREAESVANLFSALDGSASRFLSGDALSGFQSTRQSDQLRGLGFDVSASQILGATTDQVKAFTLAVLGMDSVSNDAKTALLQLSGSILDTKESAQQTAQQNALQGVDTAFAALQRSVSMQRGVLSETATELKSVFDLLKTNVRDLYGQVDGAAQAQAAKARDFISKALGAARTTGYLPDSQDLQDAIVSARSGIDATAFASKAEADFQRLVLANELRDLQEISGDQLTEAEKQIKALDSILANAQTQVDALRGIDQSVIKVETAVANLGTAIAGALGTGIKPAAGGTITAPSSRVEYSNSAVMAASGYVQSAVAAGDLMGIYQGAKANGLNSADAAYLLQLSGFDVSKEDVLAWVKSQGLPAFAGGGFHSGGLRVVGERGLEVEATGASRIWNQQQIAAAMGGSNAELVTEVRLLRLEVAELRSAGDRTAANTGRSAEVLTSVKNGNSLVTAAAPTF